MYRIIDNYGTNKTAWFFCEALAWLAACSPQAAIVNRFTGRLICARRVEA